MIKIFTAISLLLMSCEPSNTQSAGYEKPGSPVAKFKSYPDIGSISVPDGFTRLPCSPGSFGYWLRKIGLKSSNVVYLYNGRLKSNQNAQFAVMNISVGNKDLQQCADAVMRLRAEFLFEQRLFSDITFSDNLGKKYAWKGGVDKTGFPKYLDLVFGMCGTASLDKQLKNKSMNGVEPGDVLIRGGFPGHAMMVVDVAVNKKGERLFMLAQSYMPAQDIHIVKNPREMDGPWYEADSLKPIITPEWTFTPGELKRW